jgi:hypothetical protein
MKPKNMAPTRLIDATPLNSNPKDVEVLVLGFSRTGAFHPQ